MTNTPPAEYVQPIMLLLDKTDPADAPDAIRAVARASVGLWLRDGSTGPAWEEWLNGPFAKSVRRAAPNVFEKTLAGFDADDYELVTVGTAKAAAFRPVRADELPTALRKLQVAGTELPSVSCTAVPANAPTVFVNGGLGMSTGKAAAQAAHALFLYALRHEEFADVDCRIITMPETLFDLMSAADDAEAHIVDAGRTEIEPGSLTAFVRPAGKA